MLELHTTATANGYRASIMLEACELDYRVHACDLTKGEHLAPCAHVARWAEEVAARPAVQRGMRVPA